MGAEDPRLQRAEARLIVVAFNWLFAALLMLSAYLAFAPVTPPNSLHLWAVLVIVQLTIWGMISLRMIPGMPTRGANVEVWLVVGKLVALGNNLVVVAGIWLLVPYGPVELRTTAVLYCVSYIAIMVLATPNFSWVHYATTISATGSLILVLARNPTAYSGFLIPFLAVFAAGILLLGRILHRTMLALGTARRSADLARLEAEAQRDARMAFLASASHDLGQPLQSARLYFEQMRRSSIKTERVKATLGLEWSLDAMEQMVTQVTNFLRLDAGAVSPSLETVSLNKVIARTVEINEPPARLKSVQLRMMPTGLVVRGDAVLIERALNNLIGNAIRHGRATRVLVGQKRHQGRVRLWVIDDGCGIPLVDQAVLFEPYVQGSNHRGEIRGGFGLGLASARLMAVSMQGSAGYEPRWVHGSAFFLELPVS